MTATETVKPKVKIVNRKRPLLVTIAGILGFIGIVFSFPSVFSPFIKRLGDWYPALFGMLISLRFMSIVGIWFMKKWAVRVYLIVFVLNEVISLMVDDINYIELAFSAIIALLIIPFYDRMDSNL